MERRSQTMYRDPPSLRIIEAVAAHSNIPMTELPPLFDSIDPDALDALFQPAMSNGRIAFAYDNYQVTVDSNGDVELNPDGE